MWQSLRACQEDCLRWGRTSRRLTSCMRSARVHYTYTTHIHTRSERVLYTYTTHTHTLYHTYTRLTRVHYTHTLSHRHKINTFYTDMYTVLIPVIKYNFIRNRNGSSAEYVCLYICMYVCMYVCMHVRVCTYACACMHVCIYLFDKNNKFVRIRFTFQNGPQVFFLLKFKHF